MDLIISKSTITIKNAEITQNEVMKIYSPIRKSMLKNRGLAPTVNLLAHGKKGQRMIRVNFLGDKDVSQSMVETAIDELTRQLRTFEKSDLPVDKFANQLKVEFGVEDHEGDLETVTPSAAWMAEQRRKSEEKIAPVAPPFAVRVTRSA